MARVAPPLEKIDKYLRKEMLLASSGGGVHKYDHNKPKRLYERIDGKFVGVGWKVRYYRGYDYRDSIKISILDSDLE